MSHPSEAITAITATDAINQTGILRTLSAEIKKQLEPWLKPQTVLAGEFLFHEGDPADALYLIARGVVQVLIQDKVVGLSVELARLYPGAAVGEMALITGERRSASVKALEECQVYVLEREIFNRLAEAAPEVGLTIAGVLARRLEKLNQSQGVDFGTLGDRPVSDELLELLPRPLMLRHKVVPIAQEGGTVTVATPDPANRLAMDDVRRMLRGFNLKVMAVSEGDFERFSHSRLKAPVAPSTPARPPLGAKAPPRQITYHALESGVEAERSVGPQEVANTVSAILAEAIERGASDIHIEPTRQGVLVRYRVAGRLMSREGLLPRHLLNPMFTRIKVLSNLDITERRLPQDGRFSISLNNRDYDLRLATVATQYGEKMTLRLLDSAQLQQDLNQLILLDSVALLVRRLFQQNSGMVLVTGPTGSGKTTTLYAGLQTRLTGDLSICTVEDPIEYELPGVTQVQVKEDIGLGFAEVIRTFLRQSPDIVMIGETRDERTAHLAANAALTGHLVLTSLHTRDAFGVVPRLTQMGVPPYLLSSTIAGVVNQRLVRRSCPNCVAPAATHAVLEKAFLSIGERPPERVFREVGCEMCHQTGFRGQVAVFELLLASPAVKDAIARQTPLVELRRAAADAFMPMASYARYLLERGVTVPSEVMRVMPDASGLTLDA